MLSPGAPWGRGPVPFREPPTGKSPPRPTKPTGLIRIALLPPGTQLWGLGSGRRGGPWRTGAPRGQSGVPPHAWLQPNLHPPGPALPGAGLFTCCRRHVTVRVSPLKVRNKASSLPGSLQCQVFSRATPASHQNLYHLEKGPRPSPIEQRTGPGRATPRPLDLPGREPADRRQVAGLPRFPWGALGPHKGLFAQLPQG